LGAEVLVTIDPPRSESNVRVIVYLLVMAIGFHAMTKTFWFVQSRHSFFAPRQR
jgi:hypothetical protein